MNVRFCGMPFQSVKSLQGAAARVQKETTPCNIETRRAKLLLAALSWRIDLHLVPHTLNRFRENQLLLLCPVKSRQQLETFAIQTSNIALNVFCRSLYRPTRALASATLVLASLKA